MKTYIALLRGINVSGHKIIKMETLRKVLEELDFKNISTYIQSGNIIFQSDVSDTAKLEHQIAGIIVKHFGFDVPVTVITPEELKKVFSENPYANHTIDDPAQPYVAFLSEIPTSEKLDLLRAVDFKGDIFANIGKALYLQYKNHAGDSKLSNTIIESKLKLRATSRNWRTIQKLIEMAEAINQ
jgi:uncharacterized protein (DUF1697 family)